MNNQKDIDLAYLREAYKIASKYSDDPDTENGALIVRDNSVFDLSEKNLLGYGANSLPRGVKKLPGRLKRPEKYDWIGHAERHAIYDTGRKGNSTLDGILYCPWFACADCGDAIVEAGIKEIIGYTKPFEWDKESKNKKGQKNWENSIGVAFYMFDEAEIPYRIIDGDMGGVEIIFKGEKRRP